MTGLETDVWLLRRRRGGVLPRPGGAAGPPAASKVADTTAAELAELDVPRMADVYEQLGTAFECSVDVKSPDAAAGAGRRGSAGTARSNALWVCSPDVEVLRPLRAEPLVKLVHSDRRTAIPVPLERHAHELGSLGIDAMNLHHSEWSAGLCRSSIASTCGRSRGTRRRSVTSARCCAIGVDARLLRPPRAHGRDRHRVGHAESVSSLAS